MKKVLVLEQHVWDGLSKEHQASLQMRHTVKMISYAPAEDLEQLREMAPVARKEVAHG